MSRYRIRAAPPRQGRRGPAPGRGPSTRRDRQTRSHAPGVRIHSFRKCLQEIGVSESPPGDRKEREWRGLLRFYGCFVQHSPPRTVVFERPLPESQRGGSKPVLKALKWLEFQRRATHISFT